MATDIGPKVATACFRAISSPLGRSTNPAMKKVDVGYTLGEERGTSIYGLDRYVTPDRVWLVRVSIRK